MYQMLKLLQQLFRKIQNQKFQLQGIQIAKENEHWCKSRTCFFPFRVCHLPAWRFPVHGGFRGLEKHTDKEKTASSKQCTETAGNIVRCGSQASNLCRNGGINTEIFLEGESVWELAGVPDWAYFDGHDFPHTLQGKAEGPDPFIVYVTGSGACYHKPGCRMAKGGRAVNICEAKQHGKCACSVCKPMEKLPDFVERYQRIKNIQRTFGIKMLP